MVCTIWLKFRKRLWDSLSVLPCGQGIYIRLQHFIFHSFYIIQQYENIVNLANMLGFQAIVLPSTEQKVEALEALDVVGSVIHDTVQHHRSPKFHISFLKFQITSSKSTINSIK